MRKRQFKNGDKVNLFIAGKKGTGIVIGASRTTEAKDGYDGYQYQIAVITGLYDDVRQNNTSNEMWVYDKELTISRTPIYTTR